ncbi:hypothetical protein [Streptomyces lavendulae]|uniref:hypothetical protein n=1 Tax=Streptomyces lavendulae TaxID=1914 RepID=UPI0031EDCDA2
MTTAWDSAWASTAGLSPAEESDLIWALAAMRSGAARKHGGGCPCVGCQVRRVDANMRALRKLAADAKAVAA